MYKQTFFEELFDGLWAHEILLMVFGSLLFLVLLFILVFYVVKNRPLKGVLVFFLLPVIMIGFSSFKKIEFLGMVAELKDNVEEMSSKDVLSEKDKIELQENLAKLGTRKINDPESLTSLSRANAIVGDTLKAIEFAEQTIEKAPDYTPIRSFHKELITEEVIQKGIEDVEKNPDDAKAREILDKRTDILESKNSKVVEDLVISAKAREALGELEKAADLSKSALRINPENTEAKELQRRIRK